MLVKIPKKFMDANKYECIKQSDVYLNTSHIQAIEVVAYEYNTGLEYHVHLFGLNGYIVVGMATNLTEQLKDELIECIDEVMRVEKQ